MGFVYFVLVSVGLELVRFGLGRGFFFGWVRSCVFFMLGLVVFRFLVLVSIGCVLRVMRGRF